MQLVMSADLDALREDDDLAPHLANRRENADDYGTVCAIKALSRRYQDAIKATKALLRRYQGEGHDAICAVPVGGSSTLSY